MALKAIPIEEVHALSPCIIVFLDIPATQIFELRHRNHIKLLHEDLLLEIPGAIELVRLVIKAVSVVDRAIVDNLRNLKIIRSFCIELELAKIVVRAAVRARCTSGDSLRRCKV